MGLVAVTFLVNAAAWPRGRSHVLEHPREREHVKRTEVVAL